MTRQPRAGSIFSQRLDRVAFFAYLLGAVVPLTALAITIERFVIPGIADRLTVLAPVGGLVSVIVLSLASFFILRRTVRVSVAQIDTDNQRLSALLGVSNSLGEVLHASEAGERIARASLQLVDSRGGFILTRNPDGVATPLSLASAVGPNEKLEPERVDSLLELATLVISEGRPALMGAAGDVPAMAAVPLPGETVTEGALIAVGPRGRAAFDGADLSALGSLGALAAVALRTAELKDSQRNFFAHVTELLVSALDTTLGYHKGHGTRVAEYSNRLGRKLGLDDESLKRLHFSALLHDVGMLKIERELPQNGQTSAKHCMLGARMLGNIRLWSDLAPIVQHHHERWDGSGYPEGVSGDSIPLESRIIAVCDAFDSMTSSTSYKDALTLEDARSELEVGAGTQFDPRATAAMIALLDAGELEIVEV
jgi:putative nucleotidyltransferase with HDIG domain